MYVHWQRQFLHPMLKAFDAPSREECTAERPRSNTPLAALVLLNDPTFVEAARAFANRILKEGGKTTQARITWAFEHAVSRAPDAFELKTLEDLLKESLADYRKNAKDADALHPTTSAPISCHVRARRFHVSGSPQGGERQPALEARCSPFAFSLYSRCYWARR